MSAAPLLYRAAMRLVAASAPLVPRGRSKLSRGVEGRRHAHEALAAWGEAARDPARPTAWFHAPSVGEALQAGAVIHALGAWRPDLQVALTYFSPSAEGVGARVGAHTAAYLPWDVRTSVRRALDGVRPDVLVFTKTEIWPVLVEEAVRRAVPVAMIAATVPPGAGRTRWPATAVLRPAWGSLSLACACADEDGARLVALGVPKEAVRVTGDPGVDAAAERARRADTSAPSLAPFRADGRPTVVAGSTWPHDEAVLLPALAETRIAVPDVRAIVVPHEPTASRVRHLMEQLSASGWTARTLADVEAGASAVGADAVVVDRVGVLAHLYTIADVAYVGGGFGRSGLHSVLEPAAARVPVLFGPRHGRAPAAAALVIAGGARVVSNPTEMAAALTVWLTDPEARARASEGAFGYIGAHEGAAARTAALLDPLFTSRRPR